MSIQQNQIPETPSLTDLFNAKRKEIFLNLNCHHIGTVQSFNPAIQTATATINYKKTFFQPDPITGVYGPVLQDYPLIIDAPVVVLGGGLGALTFPITTGDECLVLFNDRDIDTWFQSGGVGAPNATPRLHSFSDAMILVGVRSLAKALAGYSAIDVRLYNGTTIIELSPALALIQTQLGGTLGTALQALLTDLSTMSTAADVAAAALATASRSAPLTPLTPGFTSLAAAFTAFTSSLTTVVTTIGAILA